MQKPFSRKEAEQFFALLSAREPEPKTELRYLNAFTLLVAVVLSAQATDKGVNKATGPLFAVADTPDKMAALGEEGVAGYIRTIGLYRTKAKNVVALSRVLISRHQGRVPSDRAALEALPGVGRKTANVVLNVAFAEPTIAVDTHIFRVANRTGLAPGKTPLAVELGLEKIVPAAYRQNAHHWLILHGRYVCVARKPRCTVCIVRAFCRFEGKTEEPTDTTTKHRTQPRQGRAEKTAGKIQPSAKRTVSVKRTVQATSAASVSKPRAASVRAPRKPR
ncbi:MAG: endonuclease III [Alphaproteobacteria bacterium]|nr:endonuclease III [Alphaproteobacteria bacterium]